MLSGKSVSQPPRQCASVRQVPPRPVAAGALRPAVRRTSGARSCRSVSTSGCRQVRTWNRRRLQAAGVLVAVVAAWLRVDGGVATVSSVRPRLFLPATRPRRQPPLDRRMSRGIRRISVSGGAWMGAYNGDMGAEPSVTSRTPGHGVSIIV